MMLALGAVLAFTAAASGVFNLRLSVAVDNRDHARNLAEAVVAMALAEIGQMETFGLGGETVQFPVTADYPPNSRAVLSFDPATAGSYGIPASTHNLYGGTPIPGSDGAQVPRNTVRLVGLGQVDEVEYVCEVLFYRPPIPNGIVATGTIDAEALFLAGVQASESFPGAWAGVAAGDQLPAHLFSNSREQPHAVTLRAGCDITGNVGSRGSIDVQPGALVRGEIRPGAAELSVLDLDIEDMIARVEAAVGLWPYPPTTPVVVGLQVYPASQVITGDVQLEGGAICVRGDLRITGKVSGQGALLATGSITLERGSDFAAEDMVALAAGGDVRITGSGSAGSFFHGLVYSEGDIGAQNVTVLGTVVANGPPGKGNLSLRDVNLIQSPISISFNTGLPLWDFWTDNPADYFKEENDEDGTWIVQATRRSTAKGEELFDFQMWCLNSASDLDPGDKNFNGGVIPFMGEFKDLSREAFVAKVKSILDQHSTTYWPLFEEQFLNYVAELSEPTGAGPVLNFDLNEVLSPIEGSRVLHWRRLR